MGDKLNNEPFYNPIANIPPPPPSKNQTNPQAPSPSQTQPNTQPPPPPNANEFSKFMFDNIIQGIKLAHDSTQSSASHKGIGAEDIILEDTSNQGNSQPTPSVNANEFSKFMFDNIIQGMKQAPRTTAKKPK